MAGDFPTVLILFAILACFIIGVLSLTFGLLIISSRNPEHTDDTPDVSLYGSDNGTPIGFPNKNCDICGNDEPCQPYGRLDLCADCSDDYLMF